MLKKYGFKLEEAEVALNANKHNQVTTTYYLLHKRYEMLGTLKSNLKIEKSMAALEIAEPPKNK